MNSLQSDSGSSPYPGTVVHNTMHTSNPHIFCDVHHAHPHQLVSKSTSHHAVQSTSIDGTTIRIYVPCLRHPATNRTVNRNALNFQHGHMAGMEACNIVVFQISGLARYLAALSTEHQMSTPVHDKTPDNHFRECSQQPTTASGLVYLVAPEAMDSY